MNETNKLKKKKRTSVLLQGACFNLTDGVYPWQTTPAACLCCEATGRMPRMGRTTAVVKTGQEVAAKLRETSQPVRVTVFVICRTHTSVCNLIFRQYHLAFAWEVAFVGCIIVMENVENVTFSNLPPKVTSFKNIKAVKTSRIFPLTGETPLRIPKNKMWKRRPVPISTILRYCTY